MQAKSTITCWDPTLHKLATHVFSFQSMRVISKEKELDIISTALYKTQFPLEQYTINQRKITYANGS